MAAAAAAAGLSHLYVEVGTSPGGFFGTRWLDELLPAARAAGVRVIGSVYPCLDDLAADLAGALLAVVLLRLLRRHTALSAKRRTVASA